MENMTLETFIQSFHQQEQEQDLAEEQNRRRQNKKYIFSQLFSNQNPTLMRIASLVYDWAMQNTGVAGLFEVLLFTTSMIHELPFHFFGFPRTCNEEQSLC